MIDLNADKAWIFRITHIDNVPWILANGLHCPNSKTVDPNFRQIGNPDLIRKRSKRVVPIPPGGTLEDYIPFYFTPLSPMLYNIKTGRNGTQAHSMDEIVILVSSLYRVAELGLPFVFTNSHAYPPTTEFSSNLDDLNRIDWPILAAHDFKRDPEDPGKIDRYQAEALIHRHLPVTAIKGLACFGPTQESRLNGMLLAAGVSLKVLAKHEWFF